MKAWKALLVTLTATTLSLLAASPAAADGARAYHGKNWGEIRSVPNMVSYNDQIIVCDGEPDSTPVFARYHLVSLTSSFSQYRTVYDNDGANNNSCGIANYQGGPYYARAIQICEVGNGCGAWAYPPERRSAAGKGITS